MSKSDLSPDEQQLLVKLAHRQHESAEEESRLMKQWGNRAALARQVWGFMSAVVIGAVFGTGYILSIKADLYYLRQEFQYMRSQVERNSIGLQEVRLEVKDKVSR